MKCLNNISRFNVDNNLLMKLLKLYEKKGKEIYFHEILQDNKFVLIQKNIEKNTYYYSKLVNLKITDPRLKYLSSKDAVSKNDDEQFVINIKSIFDIISNSFIDYEITSNEILKLAAKLNNQIASIRYDYDESEGRRSLLSDKKNESKRKYVDELSSSLKKLIETNKNEKILILLNFFIDFINIKPFEKCNLRVVILSVYTMLLKFGFDALNYVSFFEILYDKKQNLLEAITKASYDWENGFSNVNDFYNIIIDVIIQTYDKLDKLVREHLQNDFKLRKQDFIENTISKLKDNFTKDDIRAKHPYVSMSTIDRTLKKLRDENKIRANGVGRNATWSKLEENEIFEIPTRQQISIFDLDE